MPRTKPGLALCQIAFGTTVVASLLGMGCGTTDGGGAVDPTADADGCEDGCVGTTNGTGPDVDETTTGADGADGSTGGAMGGGLPCDVADVIARNCMTCHKDPPSFGAPMPLLAHPNWLVPAASDPTRTVASMVDERIEDEARPMPEAGLMDPADREVLHAWIAAGTPADPTADCDPTTDTDGDTDGVGPDQLPCEPSHMFLAHEAGSDQPFHVPAQGADNLYTCFSFASPFPAGTQATAWAPVTDDERVLHHWLLFRTTADLPDGEVGGCNMPADAVLVGGWAPGGQNFVLPDDVGLELGDGGSFILQLHYHNTENHEDAFDASGVALCTTPTPRTYAAGMLTLGTTAIDIPAGGQDVVEEGLCPAVLTGLLPEPLHAISSFPHMHELGRSFKTEITRDGVTFPLVDVPSFSFNNQVQYPHEPAVEIRPGDALKTTCVYDNPNDYDVGFGEDTEDEMCFNFVMVYPIDVFPAGIPPVCGL